MYTIVEGKKIGRKIGFPTMNLKPVKLGKDFGVYVCQVVFENGEICKGVLHYGKRKTTDQKISLEIHLFDFEKEAYGEKIKIDVGEKIREICVFQNLEELKIQIEKDIKQAHKIINA